MKKKPVLNLKPPAGIAHTALALIRKYFIELVLSILAVLFISPITDSLRAAVLAQNEGPSFYIDQVGCVEASTPRAVDKRDADNVCQIMNIRIPAGLADQEISQIDISEVNGVPFSIRSNDRELEVKLDEGSFRQLRYASMHLNHTVRKGETLLMTLTGRFGGDSSVGIVMNGRMRVARALEIADGRVLFLTQYWRQILLLLIATLAITRYRQFVLEKMQAQLK
jgi:hypothetical protein